MVVATTFFHFFHIFFLLWKKLNKAIGPKMQPSHIIWRQTILITGSSVSFSCNMGLLLHGPFSTSSQAPRSLLHVLKLHALWWDPSHPCLPCAGPAYISGNYSQFLEKKKIKIFFFCEISFKIKCSPATFLVSILKPHPQQKHWNLHSVCTLSVVSFFKKTNNKKSVLPLSLPSLPPFNILDKFYHLF